MNVWTHITVTYDGVQMKAFINGDSVNSVSVASADGEIYYGGGMNFQIGRSVRGDEEYFPGFS